MKKSTLTVCLLAAAASMNAFSGEVKLIAESSPIPGTNLSVVSNPRIEFDRAYQGTDVAYFKANCKSAEFVCKKLGFSSFSKGSLESAEVNEALFAKVNRKGAIVSYEKQEKVFNGGNWSNPSATGWIYPMKIQQINCVK